MLTGPSHAVEVGVGQLELLQQELRQGLRAVRRDFEPHRRAELALRQLALQRLAQVLHLLLVDPQVGVAGDAELRVVDDVAAGEELVQMRVDHRRQHHEVVVAAAARRAECG